MALAEGHRIADEGIGTVEGSAHALLHRTLIADAILSTLDKERRAVVISDDDGNILAVNDAWLELLGYDRDELLDVRAEHVAANPPEARYAEIAQNGRLEATAHLRCKNGSVGAIDYLAFTTSVGGLPVVVSLTAPISTFRPLPEA